MNVSSVNQAASVAQQALTSNTSGPVVDQTAKPQTKTHQNSPTSS
ncbi:MAG: hypothetical protein ACRC9L_01845 [Brevinema sp.]